MAMAIQDEEKRRKGKEGKGKTTKRIIYCQRIKNGDAQEEEEEEEEVIKWTVDIGRELCDEPSRKRKRERELAIEAKYLSLHF
mgnify:CR=1 FL=1